RGGAHRIRDLLEPAGCDDREQSTLCRGDVPPTVWRIARGDDVRARSALKDFVSDRDSVSSGDHEEVFVRVVMNVGRDGAPRLRRGLDDRVRTACPPAVHANQLPLTDCSIKPPTIRG